jgi:hypothetical protein
MLTASSRGAWAGLETLDEDGDVKIIAEFMNSATLTGVNHG